MKKKIGYTVVAVLLSLSLTACAKNNKQKTSSSSSQASSSQVEKKQSKSNLNTSASSQSSKTAVSKKSSSQAPKQDRMSKLTAALKTAIPGMLLPTNDGLGTGSNNLNVRYTRSNNTNSVYYSVGNTPANFNATSVKNERPYAILIEKNNVSTSVASDIINYMPKQNGLPTKQLNSSTSATLEGAAGQRYLQWNKNNYSFVIQGSSQLSQNIVDRGKNVLSLSQQYQLPTTSNKGSLHVLMGDSIGSLNTVIAWQNGNNVYQLKAHDTETAFKMLNSLK